MFSRRAPTQQQEADDGEEAHFSCRICFEDSKPSQLISPCKCKGTLKYVHQSCLHKWQANVQKLGGKRDERATVCGVCRTRYTVLPPKAALHIWRKVWQGAKGIVGAACISLLAACLSGPPILHLALLLVLLLGSRSQSLLAVLLLLVGCVMASLYARGLRLVLRAEGDLAFGLALIRHGAPVEGLRPGSLLVAHQASLQGTMFSQSVVLITEKSSRGTKGVMLTQPMEAVDSQLWSHHQQQQQPAPAGGGSDAQAGGPDSQASRPDSQASSIQPPIRHYLGGPVGLPSRTGPATHIVVLHHMPAIPGAAKIIGAGGTGSTVQQQQQQQRDQVGTPAAPPPLQQWQLQQVCVPFWQRVSDFGSKLGDLLLPVHQHQQHWQLQQQQRLFQQAPVANQHPSTAFVNAVSGSTASGSTLSRGTSSSSSSSSSYGDLVLYQGGSMDSLLQAVRQASTAAAAAATAAAAAAAAPSHSSIAGKLKWQLHRGAGASAAAAAATNNRGLRHSSSSRRQQQQHGRIYGGSNADQQQQQLGAADLALLAASVRMYHGLCVWSAGQLEGEIRAGAWGVAAAELEDVVGTAPHALWEQLLHSGRTQWY